MTDPAARQARNWSYVEFGIAESVQPQIGGLYRWRWGGPSPSKPDWRVESGKCGCDIVIEIATEQRR